MSLEPKPRSMAAVTMDFDRCSSENKIWLYAGTSEYLPVLPCGSDNLWSADDQQERPRVSLQAGRGILRDHTPDASQRGSDEMVRSAWRPAECGRNDRAALSSNDRRNNNERS